MYLLGGKDQNEYVYADIIEFSHIEGKKWTKVGEMTRSRFDHGISIVDFQEYKGYCHKKNKE